MRPAQLPVLGCRYTGARNDTTQQARQTTDKEVEMQIITLYVIGCTETDTTGLLSPSTDGEYFNTLRMGLLNCLNARSRGLNFRHRASSI